jgi:hypothetical protein
MGKASGATKEPGRTLGILSTAVTKLHLPELVFSVT